MAARISQALYRLSSGRVALLALVIFVLFTALVLPGQAQQAEAQSGGAGSPDTSFFYSPEDLYSFAQAYGPEGRAAYVRARFTFDLVWPLVYTFFLATGISWLLGRVFEPDSSWRLANLAPLLALLFDYLENSATSLVMLRYPELTPAAAWLAPVFTLIKWLFVYGSFGLLLVAAVAALWSWWRDRRAD